MHILMRGTKWPVTCCRRSLVVDFIKFCISYFTWLMLAGWTRLIFSFIFPHKKKSSGLMTGERGGPNLMESDLSEICPPGIFQPISCHSWSVCLSHTSSSVLNPLDFFVWGYMKDEIHRAQPGSIAEVKQMIQNFMASIISEDLLQRVTGQFVSRIRRCIEAHGGVLIE